MFRRLSSADFPGERHGYGTHASAAVGEASLIHKRLPGSLSVLTLMVISCSLLLVLHQAALLYTAYSGHDQAWYLIAAQRVLEGAQLYGPHVSDTNPPMIVWFSMFPVLLARVLPLSATVCLRLIVFLLLLASAAWCLRILQHVPWMKKQSLFRLAGLCILYVTLRIAPIDFGQREHLFVIFALPYLFAAGTDVFERFSKVERCAVGLAAGVAICFKPQNALVFLAAETVLLIDRRTLRRLISPEAVALAASCGIYFLAVRMLTPLYTKQVVPLLLDTYWAYGTSSMLELLLAMKVRLLIAVTLLVMSFFSLRKHPSFKMMAIFAACSVGAWLAYAIQRTDWTYHRYPTWAFSNLAIAGFLLKISQSLLERMDSHRVSRSLSVGWLAAAFVAGLGFFPRQVAALRPERSKVYRYLAENKPGTVLVLSTTVIWMADVVDSKWSWGGRFPCLGFLPALVQNEQGQIGADTPFRHLSPEKLTKVSSIQRTEVAEDLNYFKPSLVMIEHCDEEHSCQALEGRTFDVLAWFLQDQQFAEAWSHYKRQPGDPDDFDLYVRIP
jgi:hypothetical protein